jgi:DNA-binding NtrC family response regulator
MSPEMSEMLVPELVRAVFTHRGLGHAIHAVEHELGERRRLLSFLKSMVPHVVKTPIGLEDLVLVQVFEAAGGNHSAAARLVGMERKAFVRRLARAKRAR